MVSLFGRGFESHQLHPNKSESPVVRLNYRTFAFYYIMYQCLHNCSSSSLVIPVINLLIRVKDIKKALFDLIYCQRMSIFDVY